MKKYTIFYKEHGSYLLNAVYVDDNGKYWLGSGKADWILTRTKAEAEKIARKVRRQKSPFSFDKGVILVEQAKLEPLFNPVTTFKNYFGK